MVKYKPGDVIVECTPFVADVNSENRGKRCDNCFVLCHSPKRCAKCLERYYCSKDCQKRDWKWCHKFKECDILATAIGKQIPRLLLRFVLKVKVDPLSKDKEYVLFNGLTRKVSDLMSHEDSTLPRSSNSYHNLVKYFVSLNIVSDELELAKLWSQLKTNSFYVVDHINDPNGEALYIEASIFDHSCRPNASRTFEGFQMQVRALADIDTDCEGVYINYCPLFMAKQSRQDTLMRVFNFKCQCDRCEGRFEELDLDTYDKLKDEMRSSIETGNNGKAFEYAEQCFTMARDYVGAYSTVGCDLKTIVFDNYVLAVERKQIKYDKRKADEYLNALKDQLNVIYGSEHSFFKHLVLQAEAKVKRLK